MKNLLMLLLAGGLVVNVNAQTAKEPTCLESYQKAFSERGANPVEDGTYKTVVVSIVSKNGTDCFSGKAKVEQNYVTAIYIAYEDNTYEFLDRKYKGEAKAKIVNGITEPLLTEGSEKIYVIFTEKIKPKKKQFKKITGPDKNF